MHVCSGPRLYQLIISALSPQVVGEQSESAATKMHLWLERTAFYKVPKSHQDEVADQCQKPFEQVCLFCPII